MSRTLVESLDDVDDQSLMRIDLIDRVDVTVALFEQLASRLRERRLHRQQLPTVLLLAEATARLQQLESLLCMGSH